MGLPLKIPPPPVHQEQLLTGKSGEKEKQAFGWDLFPKNKKGIYAEAL